MLLNKYPKMAYRWGIWMLWAKKEICVFKLNIDKHRSFFERELFTSFNYLLFVSVVKQEKQQKKLNSGWDGKKMKIFIINLHSSRHRKNILLPYRKHYNFPFFLFSCSFYVSLPSLTKISTFHFIAG
jgi:hypothetical protein